MLAMIPARGGSKRLPGKNLLPLGGAPLIAHTCHAARMSHVFSAIYVNTDCAEIAAAAARAGVACPALRPPEFAQDATPTRDAVLWMLETLASRGERYEALALLQPTSPLRSEADIAAAVQLFRRHGPCAVVSVTRVAPQDWLGAIDGAGRFTRHSPGADAYRLNGAIYLYPLDAYRRDPAALSTYAYVMPPERSVDIDDRSDFALAEALWEQQRRAADVRQAVLAGVPAFSEFCA